MPNEIVEAARKADHGERRKVAPLFRAAAIEAVRADGQGGNMVEITFSSEEPYERWFGVEILGHAPGEVRMDWIASGNAPFLLDHDQRAEAQIGVVERAWIGDDRRGHALVRFSSNEKAQAILADVRDGVRSNVSVGYRVHRLELVGKDGETDIFRVTDWEPFELSLVTVPADTTVGVGRAGAVEENEAVFIRREQMTKDIIEEKQAVLKAEDAERKADDGKTAAATATTVAPGQPSAEELAKRAAEEMLARERKRVEEVMALARKHSMIDLGERAVKEGWSVERMRGAILDRYGEQPPTAPIGEQTASIGMSEREAQEYSFLRALQAAATNDWSQAPFEREVSQAVARQLGQQPHGFFVPEEVQQAQRDLNVSSGTGGNLVGTQHLASSFIDMYRNRLMVRRAGARVLSGLTGNVEIPRQSGGATANWIANENDPAQQSEPSFDQVQLSPKTCASFAVMSRNLLMQSSPDVEELVRADLANAAAQAVDGAAISGSGASGQPTGILNVTGIGLVSIGTDGGPLTWDHLVALETEVAVDNADVGALAYMTNAKVRGKLKVTEKASGTAQFIWADVPQEAGVGMVNGYRAYVTNQVPDNLTKGAGTGLSAVLFGNWADLIIGEWGVLDVLVNPFSLDTTGQLRITVFKTVDVAVRHPESFAAIKDAATA